MRTVLVDMRARLARSGRPERIFETVPECFNLFPDEMFADLFTDAGAGRCRR